MFDEKHKNMITTLVSDEGEIVPMSTMVEASGPVEEWLNTLELGMMETMKDIIRRCSVVSLDEDLQIESFIRMFPAQVDLLGLQFRWTFEAESALIKIRSDKRALDDSLARMKKILDELTLLTQNPKVC